MDKVEPNSIRMCYIAGCKEVAMEPFKMCLSHKRIVELEPRVDELKILINDLARAWVETNTYIMSFAKAAGWDGKFPDKLEWIRGLADRIEKALKSK